MKNEAEIGQNLNNLINNCPVDFVVKQGSCTPILQVSPEKTILGYNYIVDGGNYLKFVSHTTLKIPKKNNKNHKT